MRVSVFKWVNLLRLNRTSVLILVCGSLLISAPLSSQELWETLPQANKAVHDFANIIDANTERNLEQFLRDTEQSLNAAIVIVTLANLDGGQIDDFTNRLYEKWGLSNPTDQRGVLYLVAMQERLMRIEVGYGLEPIITDTFSASLISDVARPNFRNGNFSGGIDSVTRMIVGAIAETEGKQVQGSRNYRPSSSKKSGRVISIIEIIFFLIVFLSSWGGIFGRRRLRSSRMGPVIFTSGGFRGSSGGGFGSSGGFGGFGGGFSGGGGASGGW